jgi:hypothetical protein
MVAVVLLVLLVGSLCAGVALVAPAPQTVAAGCHGHGSKVPSPKPVSYQCCITGHRQALASITFSVTPPVCAGGQVCVAQPILAYASVTPTSAFSTEASPGFPGQIPLRV